VGQSLLKVCDSCGSAVARKGADVASYGKVADLIPTPSVLKLGIEGRYEGAPSFHLAGRLQLDHGAGTWDEWLVAFDNDQWSWLSESQGKFHYMGRAALPPVPDFEDIKPGHAIDLGPPGTFVVTEVKKARFVTAQGELPFDVKPGSELHYADLSGPKGQFATLDYGTGNEAEALYVGNEVTLDQIGIREIASAEERRKKVSGGSLSCTQCGGPLELKAPDQAKRIGCPWCGSLLDATKDFAVLAALQKPAVVPDIPLGTQGTLSGVPWTVIGFMVRSVEVEGIRYGWHEYLLYEPRRGFRWLTNNNGHWSFVEPVHAGDVSDSVAGGVSWQGERYKHFQSSLGRVDHVLGEFYWAVSQGDTSHLRDYVSPPRFLSSETTAEETVWTVGTYLEPQEVWGAFGLEGHPPRPSGVAPNQPWPWKSQARAIYGMAAMVIGLMFLGYIVLTFMGGGQIHRQTFEIPDGVQPGAPQAAVFSEPFEVKRSGNLQITTKAPVNNSWLYLDGALIQEETGDFYAFDTEVSYYSGRDSDGAWTEGGTTSRRYLGGVSPGRYVLRLGPQWQSGRAPRNFEVTVRSRIPRFYQVFLAMLAVGLWPLIVAWKSFSFEVRRWSESDHAWVTEG
jgi:hypothetical protein